MKFTSCLLFLSVLIVSTLAIGGHVGKPGFITSVSQNGLNYFTNVSTIALGKTLVNLQVEGEAGTEKVPMIGTIHYNITQVTILNVIFHSSSVTITPNKGLVLQMAATAGIKLNYYYTGKSKGHGTATVVSTFNVVADTALGQANGQPQILSCEPVVSINSFKIHLTGTKSGIFNMFKKAIGGMIKKNVAKSLTRAMRTTMIQSANKALSSYPLKVPIKPPMVLDVSLSQNPVFGPAWMAFHQAGDIYDSRSAPVDCPANVCPQRDMPTLSTQRHVQIFVSDYVANSFGFTAQRVGFLSSSVKPSDVPADVPFKLNTESLKGMIPPLAAKYPGKNLTLVAAVSAPPSISFKPTGVSFVTPLQLQFNVIDGASTPNAFIMAGTVKGDIQVALSGWKLTGKIANVQTDWTIQSSNIGDINIVPIKNAMKFAQAAALPPLNQDFAKGFDLPTAPGLTFLGPQLTFHDGYMSIQTDVRYDV